jgi:membrane carboxypeptidase/penicillin-binding protein
MVVSARPRRDIGFHFVDQVSREARTVAGLDRMTDTSYTVRSTIDQPLQKAVEEALQEGLARYERNNGRAQFMGPEATLARFTVEKDQPHRLDTLACANAGRLFDGFEETKKGCQLQSR